MGVTALVTIYLSLGSRVEEPREDAVLPIRTCWSCPCPPAAAAVARLQAGGGDLLVTNLRITR